MNERIKKVTTVVKEKWSGFSTPVRVMLLSIPVVIIAIIILLAILLNRKDTSILYSGLSTGDAAEIGAAIEAMGVDSKDIQISGGTVRVPAEKQDELLMKLAVQGYPKTSTNYDIWKNGQSIWNTQGQLNELARQQREANIAAAVRQLDAVLSCTAILDIPETKEYTINPDKKPPSCSLTLTLNNEEKLTNEEVRAIYKIVSKAVEGLVYENIEIVDTKGRGYDYISKEEEEALGVDKSGVPVAIQRLNFQQSIQSSIYSNISKMLEKIYGENGYTLGVDARINFDSKSGERVEYYPSDPAGNGNNTGVASEHDVVSTRTDLNNVGGLPGDTPNADLSPEYPTVIVGDDEEGYYYYRNQIRYLVSYYKEEFGKDGYSLDNVSLGVTINTDNMTQTEKDDLAQMIANAAGTTADKVSVVATPFVISPNQSGSNQIYVPPVRYDPYRNMLLMLVIALGVILVILLIASLFISRSRKKKIRRRQELALAAAQAAAESNVAFEHEAPEEVDFNITSLTEEAGRESRETILKREIAEFARTSPDIVASIIRNMLRDE